MSANPARPSADFSVVRPLADPLARSDPPAAADPLDPSEFVDADEAIPAPARPVPFRRPGDAYPRRHFREIPMWRDVTDEQWNNWHWQVARRIRTPEQLAQVVDLTPEEFEAVRVSMERFRMSINPYYALLMDPVDRKCPIRMLSVPTAGEMVTLPEEALDPLHETVDSPVPGLTHRYPDRVLFLVTDMCSMYCRHCTRRHYTGHDRAASLHQIDACIEYIRRTPAVRDVLISGGDGLLIGDARLEYILSNLRAIPHVEIIRIGTRMPVVNPMRITRELCAMLKKYHPIYVNTHFNHPKEITGEAAEACERLADAGIQVGNQTVLLRDLNDCPHLMRTLMHELLKIRVRPYYIYQCDLTPGLGHFRTTVQKGLEIMEMLQGHTTGFAVPTYVIDAPGGGGKIPVMPNYVLNITEEKVILRNYEGVVTAYTQPSYEKRRDDPCPLCGTDHRSNPGLNHGVGGLLTGERVSLEPEGLERRRRIAAWRRAHPSVGLPAD